MQNILVAISSSSIVVDEEEEGEEEELVGDIAISNSCLLSLSPLEILLLLTVVDVIVGFGGMEDEEGEGE